MDENTRALVITISVAAIAIIATVVVTFYVSLQQGNKYEAAINGLRGEMRDEMGELRGEVRALGERVDALGERFSAVESRQSRLEGANEALAEVLRRQSHTHESSD